MPPFKRRSRFPGFWFSRPRYNFRKSATDFRSPKMCITGQIPDPTTPGVWWRDDTVWRLYQNAHADVIKQGIQNGLASVTLYGVQNCVQPVHGETYTVNLRGMQQRSPRGFLRTVLIVGAAAAAGGPPATIQNGQTLALPPSSSSGPRPPLQVWHRDPSTGGWNQFSASDSRFLLDAARHFKSPWTSSVIDFASMTMTDTATGVKTDVRIACPLDGQEVASAVAAAEMAQRKERLYEMVESLRAPEKAEPVLQSRVRSQSYLPGVTLDVTSVRANSFLSRGNPLYERFVATLARHMPDLRGLLENGGVSPSNPHSVIEHVFHGTPPDNRASIMKHGMNPSLRTSGADYFSTNAAVSIGFCGNELSVVTRRRDWAVKLLVFLVLKLPPGFEAKRGNVVTMREVEYELPILEVTVHERGC
ncbi:hypothetical protein KFL_000060290 [Klebsormidium nitens]|uniref:WWE domain-containing protein n=1 Tax=Klebsormidium nitens TaxID=105231 RepID=A0A0U9HHR9_KLENI|nr:hypothetical protein KFL_000060290 [Klebsormidium nitens]|eukprot:GAQ77964.1 hypothetical protein KFL_000060290 [Klebsormidium nitens]